MPKSYEELLGFEKPKPPMAPKPSKIPGQEPVPYKEEWVKDMPILKVEELHPPKPSVKNSSDLILEKLDLILSILKLDPNVIEKGLRRADTSIHNKPSVKEGKGQYYEDHVAWTLEIDKLQEFKKNRQALMVELKERLKEVKTE